MSEAGFDERVAAARARVAALRQGIEGTSDTAARAVLAEALEELGFAFEELRVAQEELRARTAAELRQLNAELEARVESRTAALRELLRGKEAAEKWLAEADRRKDEFLATLAHELRSPLAAIQSAVGVVHVAGVPGPAGERALGVIDRQSRRMARLVADLLDVSRVAQGKLSVQMETVDLAEAARTAAEAVAAQAAGAGVRTEVSADRVYVRADSGRLEQVLTNLLTNAIKYTNAGGAVTVRVAPEGGRAVVRVRDTGVGIPPDVLPHVFDLFVQAHAGRSQGGLGIGLHLVKRLVEFHGGTVEAHSAGPGTGSEFVVRLPAVSPP